MWFTRAADEIWNMYETYETRITWGTQANKLYYAGFRRLMVTV